jgi:chemotaxis protein methyltransferase CheR
MGDTECVKFLQETLPRLRMRWPGFRKVRNRVCKRVRRRLRELGLPDMASYQSWLDEHPGEWEVLDDYCHIPISRYRDRSVFEHLRQNVLPRLAEAAQTLGEHALHCWSAGCASGEEVYSLKLIWEMDLAARFPNLDPPHRGHRR